MDVIGLDIGGTKCSLIHADSRGVICSAETFPTGPPKGTLARFFDLIEGLELREPPVFGVACGGPLDEPAGLILSPPNLPGWDRVSVVAELEGRFGGRAYLMNDANAGALAEWQFGAGRGFRNVVFLTSGTGMGAGLILDGRLYEGTSGMAGEVGHIRLAPDGPVGYRKTGSFEGFCSGGGIAQLARARARALSDAGGTAAFQPDRIEDITARDVALAAERGDREAREILAESGCHLGMALAVILDILNPERVIIGSIYARCRAFLELPMLKVLEREALPQTLADCRVVPAELGERIGQYAAIGVALYRHGFVHPGEGKSGSPTESPSPDPKGAPSS